MTTHVIRMVAASENRRSYGITHRSANVYQMTGRGLHNRHAPHRVQVWDNTGRPNTEPDRWNDHSGKPGPGQYLDPFGKGTDSPVTVTTSAEATAITSNGTNTGTVASGQVYASDALTVGDYAVLLYPDGSTSDPYQITAQFLADPRLVPVA